MANTSRRLVVPLNTLALRISTISTISAADNVGQKPDDDSKFDLGHNVNPGKKSDHDSKFAASQNSWNYPYKLYYWDYHTDCTIGIIPLTLMTSRAILNTVITKTIGIIHIPISISLYNWLTFV